MTTDRSQPASAAEPGDDSFDLDVLQQVVREIDRLCELEHLVPKSLLWDRPPGLPSGAELLWLVHLVDEHVFIPAAERFDLDDPTPPAPPDYLALLNDNPCQAESMRALHDSVLASRSRLTEHLAPAVSTNPSANHIGLLQTVVNHDRQLLASLTERLYESGLGN